MNKSKCLTVLLLILFTIAVSSCSVGIHLAGANSISAVLAVIGEYLLAILSVVLVFILHLARPFSISLVLLSILGLLNAVALPISPYIVLTLGIFMLFSFAVPIKAYKPKVIIDRNVKKAFENDVEEEQQKKGGKGIVIEIIVGILMLCIEYLFFAKL